MNWITQAVGAMSDSSAREQNIMTLGELRAALKALPPETPVVMSDGKTPASLASYRGFYERLAISTTRHRDDYKTMLNDGGPGYGGYVPGAHDVDIAEPVTAAEMVKALNLADGVEFEGYKGGQFEMHSGTWMHAADYGDCGLAVYGVLLGDGHAVIETGEYSW